MYNKFCTLFFLGSSDRNAFPALMLEAEMIVLDPAVSTAQLINITQRLTKIRQVG